MSDYEKGVFTGLLAIIVVPLAGIGKLFYRALFIKLIYNMLIPALYNLPKITFGMAMALSLVSRALLYTGDDKYEDHKLDFKYNLISFLIRPFILYLLALLVQKFFI